MDVGTTVAMDAGARSEDALRAAPRTLLLAVRDWWPIALLLVGYLLLHELAEPLSRAAHVQPQLGFDENLFGGTSPTVRLQDALYVPGTVHWYDLLAWAVYLSHFFVTPAVAVVLWIRDRAAFLRFRLMFLLLTAAGFVTYVVYPAIPPWLASRRGDMASTVRVVHEVWAQLGLHSIAAVFGEKSDYAFPVGALPSLHAAWPFLLLLFLWPVAGRWRVLLVAYAAAMALTLMYSADHFLFDILLGWTYATVTYLVGNWWWRRRHPATTPTNVRAE
ncbi:MAG: phosphatase PAP2 family protein [Acidimicrobiia bacterium]